MLTKSDIMEKVKTIMIPPRSKQSFSLGKGQTYSITQLGFIDPNNPRADVVFKPLDSSKIRITKLPKTTLGDTDNYLVENDSESGIGIEIMSA